MVHGGVQVEIFDADRHVFCIGSGWDPLQEALGCDDGGSGSTSVSRIWGRLPQKIDLMRLVSAFSGLSLATMGLVAVVGGLDPVGSIGAGAEFWYSREALVAGSMTALGLRGVVRGVAAAVTPPVVLLRGRKRVWCCVVESEAASSVAAAFVAAAAFLRVGLDTMAAFSSVTSAVLVCDC
jgi:hypothetical protein